MSLPALVEQRGISQEVFSALKNSIYPGAADESVIMAWDYCAARGLDVMLKPVHLVPMFVKNAGGQGAMRDVVMPGIGLYRIQADRAGNYAGMDAPKFGPDITQQIGSAEITFPEWCEITVHKAVGERIVAFTAREYWIENYATAGRDKPEPNAMWKKRPRGQLVKCTEAQALRKGWPELGAQPTYEEMEGKDLIVEKDVTPPPPKLQLAYSQTDFDANFPAWEAAILGGKRTPAQIIAMVSSKAQLSDAQRKSINDVLNPASEEQHQ